MSGLIVDNFAGGGGASTGIEAAREKNSCHGRKKIEAQLHQNEQVAKRRLEAAGYET